MCSSDLLYFYSFKHGLSPCDILWKLRKCGLKDMGWFLSDLLHEPNTCVLPSGQGTLVAPQAHGRDLVPEISAQNNFYSLSDCGPKFLPKPFFPLKMVGSH